MSNISGFPPIGFAVSLNGMPQQGASASPAQLINTIQAELQDVVSKFQTFAGTLSGAGGFGSSVIPAANGNTGFTGIGLPPGAGISGIPNLSAGFGFGSPQGGLGAPSPFGTLPTGGIFAGLPGASSGLGSLGGSPFGSPFGGLGGGLGLPGAGLGTPGLFGPADPSAQQGSSNTSQLLATLLPLLLTLLTTLGNKDQNATGSGVNINNTNNNSANAGSTNWAPAPAPKPPVSNPYGGSAAPVAKAGTAGSSNTSVAGSVANRGQNASISQSRTTGGVIGSKVTQGKNSQLFANAGNANNVSVKGKGNAVSGNGPAANLTFDGDSLAKLIQTLNADDVAVQSKA